MQGQRKASNRTSSARNFLRPIPGFPLPARPPFESIIMAAGAFIQGSSIELSADGPLKEPYAVYFQGGLTWYHAKYGIMMALEKLVQAGIVTL